MHRRVRSFRDNRRKTVVLLAAISLAGCAEKLVVKSPPAPPTPPGTVRLIIDLPIVSKKECRSDDGIATGTIRMSDGGHNILQTHIPPVASQSALALPSPGAGTVNTALTLYSQARNMIAASAAVYAGSQVNGIKPYPLFCHHNIAVPLSGTAMAQVLNAPPFSLCPNGVDQCLKIPLPDWQTVPAKTGLLRYTQADQVLTLSEQAYFAAAP